MTTAATSLLGLALPVTGELAGTWGDTVNDSITSLLDTAVAGTTTLSTDGDVTLTTTTLAANQARQAILLCSGARTALRTITAPAQSKIYTIINATTGGFSVKLVGVGPTTGVTIVAGESALVAWNGSDFIKISNTGGAASFTNVTVSGTTTLSGLTASTALALDASKNVVSVTNTGSGNNVLATSPTLTTPNLGTPSALTLTNATGLPLSTGVTGTLATTNGGTGLTSFTANGVVYASSTSALATGSALTFDGQYVSIGAGASSPNGIKFLANGGGLAANLTVNHSTGEIQNFATTNYFQTWYANNSEGMRLTSTSLYTASGINVGIGTSSPAYKLDILPASGVSTAARLRGNSVTAGSNNVQLRFYGKTSATDLWAIGNDIATDNGAVAFDFYDLSASALRMRLDSSGNLGLGVTPSAWSAGKAIEVGYKGCAIWSASAVENRFQANAYYNGGWIYASNGAASNYHLTGGQHEWFIAPSGTAGDPITFTQAMTLDASGVLYVGDTTGLASRLNLAKDTNSTIETLAWLRNSGTGYKGTQIAFGEYTTKNGYITNQYISSGPAWCTDVGATDNVRFFTGAYPGTERARIDSSGNLLVGTTNSAENAGDGLKLLAGSTPGFKVVTPASTASSASFMSYSSGASAYRFYVTDAGGINATSTSITAISDQSLKENIRDLDTGLAQVLALRPRRFDWKEETQIGAKDVAGFIAQEVEAVLPELVYDFKYSEEQTKKSLKMGDILPTLVKAIQEQQALIETLTARITALESK